MKKQTGIAVILFVVITSLRLNAYNWPILHNGKSDSQPGNIVSTLGEPRGGQENYVEAGLLQDV